MASSAAIYQAAEKQSHALAAGDQEALGRMVDAYGNAWTAIARDLDRLTTQIASALDRGETINTAWLHRERRLETMLSEVETQITRFARGVAPQVLDRQRDAVAAAQANAHRLVSTALGDDSGLIAQFSRLDVGAVEQIVGHLSPGSPLTKAFAALGADARQVAEQALVSGVARGLSPRQMATQMRAALGGNLARALTLARTETLRAYREATRQTYEANADVVAGWRWRCARDRRTCAVCWAMDGTEHPVTDQLDGHPNCRCVMIPVTKTFAELGVPGVAGDHIDYGNTGPEQFATLPAGEQRRILGPGKYDLYKDGRMRLPDLVGRVDSKQWGTMRVERSLRSVETDIAARAAGRTPGLPWHELAPNNDRYTMGKAKALRDKMRADGHGEFVDAVAGWQFGETDQIHRELRALIAEGKPGTGRAVAIRDAIRASPKTSPELFRGTFERGGVDATVASFRVGGSIDMLPKSFSSQFSVADLFAGQQKGTKAGTKVYYRLMPKARGVPIENLSDTKALYSEREYVTGGRMKVRAVNKFPDPENPNRQAVLVDIEQEGVY